jgi:putative acetyltransferase
MYLLSETRGLGLGSMLLEKILVEAKADGFKRCYLETMASMSSANALYKKFGFQLLDQALVTKNKWTDCYYLKDL